MQPGIQFQLHGGQIIQIFPDTFFYLSEPENLGSCCRGGEPVIFPQFANYGPLKKHGFARDVIWELIFGERALERRRLILARNFGVGEFEGWSHEARLMLDLECVVGSIRQIFEVCNTGCSEFSWTGGLHLYFAVKDLKSSVIFGLADVPYIDKCKNSHDFVGPEQMRWNESVCEKLFDAAPLLTLDTGDTKIQLSTSGFDQWMIWNPGNEGAKAIDDLPNADWDKFVCVESVRINRPVILNPGERFIGKFDISIKSDFMS